MEKNKDNIVVSRLLRVGSLRLSSNLQFLVMSLILSKLDVMAEPFILVVEGWGVLEPIYI